MCIRRENPSSGAALEKQKRAHKVCLMIFLVMTAIALPTMTLYTIDPKTQCLASRWDRDLLSMFTIYDHSRYLIVHFTSVVIMFSFNLLLFYAICREMWPFRRKQGLVHRLSITTTQRKTFTITVKKLEAQRRQLTTSVVVFVTIAVLAESNRVLLDEVTSYGLKRLYRVRVDEVFPYSRWAISHICLMIECSVSLLCQLAFNQKFRRAFLETICKKCFVHEEDEQSAGESNNQTNN